MSTVGKLAAGGLIAGGGYLIVTAQQQAAVDTVVEWAEAARDVIADAWDSFSYPAKMLESVNLLRGIAKKAETDPDYLSLLNKALERPYNDGSANRAYARMSPDAKTAYQNWMTYRRELVDDSPPPPLPPSGPSPAARAKTRATQGGVLIAAGVAALLLGV